MANTNRYWHQIAEMEKMEIEGEVIHHSPREYSITSNQAYVDLKCQLIEERQSVQSVQSVHPVESYDELISR